MSQLARNLGLVYAFCLTLHLPKTQSIPYISADNRRPFDIEGCADTLFEHMFKFSKSEFVKLRNVGLVKQVADKDDQGEILRYDVDNTDRGILADDGCCESSTPSLESRTSITSGSTLPFLRGQR